MPASSPSRRLRFGDFELDLERRLLWRDGERIELQDKPFEVLATLVERPGAIISRNELRERLWADQIVEFDNNLNTALTKVRRALGDSANDPCWIETVPKRGYRWIGAIEEQGDSQGSQPEPTPIEPTERPRRWSPSRQALVLAALGLVVVLLPLLGRPGSLSESSPLAEARAIERTLLVVLPFVDAGSDPSGLAEVWTEELITRLAERLPRDVGVIARTSAMRYQDRALDLRELATDLGVRYAIEGSLRGGNEGPLEVQVRLIEVESQAHRWASRLEGSVQELPNLQEAVVAGVTDELGLRALPAQEADPPVPDDAWRAYLRGRHLLQQHDDREARVAEAVQSFRQAVELAPGFAPAWSALAEALHRNRQDTSAAHTEARRVAVRRAALRSLALDPSRAEPYLRMASISLYQDWDWDEADHYLSEADRLAPNSATVKHVRAAWFSTLGRHEQAQAQLETALQLDPLSVVLHADTGWYEFVSRRYEAAVARCDEALALDPSHRGAQWYRLRSLLALGRLDDANRQALDLLATEGADESLLEAARRDPEQALQRLFELRRDRLQAEVDAGLGSQAALALAHLDLGNRDEAMRLLVAGADHPGAWVYPFLAVYPPLDALREREALVQLVGRVGIP